MRHGSLFSGIGGFDLAAEWMGWDNVFHCEWNPFGQKILNHYWPQAESFGDITKTDFTKYHGSVEIISGGFPCQPYSMAGKRLGKEDERHLWPEMLRAIREIAPRWVVGENVRGLTNWNGGLVFDEVCADLENLGYQVAPYLIPAVATNAPHKRERIWFIAYAEGNGNRRKLSGLETKNGNEWQPKKHGQNNSEFGNNGDFGNASDTDSWGTQTRKFGKVLGQSDTQGKTAGSLYDALQRNASDTESVCIQRFGNGQREEQFGRGDWSGFPTQSPVCSGDDGLSTELDGITFSKWRNESIRAYGNAVVPNVVFEIFKAIQTYERNEVNKRRAT